MLGQNLTIYKIKTPERILTKFGTVNYVEEICPQTKSGDNWISGASGEYVKYTIFVTFFIFFLNGPGGHTPHQLSRKIA